MERQLPKYSSEYFFDKKNKYALLIPTLNEGERIQSQLTKIKALSLDNTVDIFILDSNSTDKSLEFDFLKECSVRAKITIFEGKQGSAFRAGINEVLNQNYDGIITVDGNNKDSMGSIFEFVKKLDEGYDFVQGSRFMQGARHENTPFIRLLAMKLLLIPLVSNLANYRYTEVASAFRAYSKNLLTEADVLRDCFVSYEFLWYMSVFAPKNHYKVTEIPTERSYPKTGKIPTKISMRGCFGIILQLFYLSIGKYNK